MGYPPSEQPEQTYTPPPVKGYRQLTQAEVDLVNQLKEAEAAYAEVWRKVKAHQGVDQRMLALGRTHMETASMWNARAVFQPDSPFDAPNPTPNYPA